MKYRSDIDGLRAVAVLPVIFFHFELPPFTGGFVGVDVFFVISGFLITSIILDEQERGRFSLLTFYERRARRILPPLFVVMAASAIMAHMLFLPGPLEEFSQSVVATTFFASNFLFWQQTGYFDAPAELKPLLHTWSLAIEEQFYVLYPLFLIFLVRVWQRRWVVGALILGLGSFILSALTVRQYPTATFYLLPFRAWELLLGAMLASNIIGTSKNRWITEAIAASGFALLLAPIFIFSEATRFPGPAAGIPCLGTAMLIYAGRAETPALATRILQLRGVVFIGLISYSLYLWHWPTIVFYKYWSMSEPDGVWTIILLVCMFCLAILSWRYVEIPIRTRKLFYDRRALVGVMTSTTALVLIVGLVGVATRGWPARMKPEILALTDTKHHWHDRRNCHRVHLKNFADICVRGAKNAIPDFILAGDSHADALSPGIFSAAASLNRSGYHYTTNAYRPLLGYITDRRNEARTESLNANLRKLINQPGIREVYYQASWLAGFRDRYRDEDSGSIVPGFVAFTRGLKALVKAHPNTRFIFIEGSPVARQLSPHIAAQALHLGRQTSMGLPRNKYEEQLQKVRPLFYELSQLPNVTILSIADGLCEGQFCPSVADGRPLYRDTDHLSPFGAKRLIGLLRQGMSAHFHKR